MKEPLSHARVVDAYFEAVRKGARKGLTVRINPEAFVARDAFNVVQCTSKDVADLLAQISAYRKPTKEKQQ